MNDLEISNNTTFESIKHIDDEGNDFWYARELQKALNYVQWRRFKNAWNNFWNGLKTNISLNANFSAGGGYGRRRRSAEVVELKVEYSILVNCQD